MDQLIKPWKRLALIFPGQGSHYVGMGKELAAKSAAARAIFMRADKALGSPISKLCFEGPAEELEDTVKQQPATFVTSLAYLAAIEERWTELGKPFEPSLYAGHSMGEFTAAVASGALTFEEGLTLVQERGLAMGAANAINPGGMATILGLPEDKVAELIAQVATPGLDGYVGLANANCEGQTTISGALEPLQKVMKLAEEAKARRVVRLPISIASHSPLMASASERMNRILDKTSIRAPHMPLIGNVGAAMLSTAGDIERELRDQLTHGVKWQKSAEEMMRQGIDLFIECGPGTVLT